jgi:hypothetical protein
LYNEGEYPAMALLNQSTQVSGQLQKLFETLRQGQAPPKFTREFLKDIGFSSSNHLAFIPLLKGLKFLTADGTPTQRYRDFLDPTRSKRILSEALVDAYGDIFTIKAKPGKADRKLISGKYKSTYNLSEVAAERAAGTFLALLDLADEAAIQEILSGKIAEVSQPPPSTAAHHEVGQDGHSPVAAQPIPSGRRLEQRDLRLHYNIQIHLPATKEIEVYNAIFKSLKDHLLD